MKSSVTPLYYLVNLDPKAERILAVDPPDIKGISNFNKDFTIFQDLIKATCYYFAQQRKFYPVDPENQKQAFFFAKINQRFNLTNED
jgi:hypothetical protein